MKKSERILLLLRGGGEWSAYEVAAVLGLWFGPYSELHRLEREGKIASRWLDMPYPRRRVYFVERGVTSKEDYIGDVYGA